MAYNVGDSFQRTTNAPRFVDEVFADITARNAYASGLRYRGLTVFVVATSKFYSLVAGITDSDWVEGVGGGKGIVVVADYGAMLAITSGDRYEGMIVYIVSTMENYQLKGGILDANWVDLTPTFTLKSIDAAITAFAGGGQGSAYQIIAEMNRVTTVATANDSVKLPAGVAGMEVFIQNDGVASLNVFPATGAAIDALATNGAYAITPIQKNATFVCLGTNVWRTKAGGSAAMVVSTVQSLAAAASIALAAVPEQRVKVKSTGGEVAVVLPNGTIDGQKVFVQGDDDDNPVKIVDAANVFTNGETLFTKYINQLYVWDTGNTKWVEVCL